MAPLLDVQHVDVSYNGRAVVHDVSFQLEAGEILGIVGESGSGKSTVIRAAMGLLGNTGAVTRGDIYYKGQSVTAAGAEELRRMRGPAMGMIFQNTEASLCPIRSIGDQLFESVCQHEKASREEVRDRALELFDRMRLNDGERILNSYPFELSGGMNQRVGIMMAMVLRPALLFADEPTSALDVTVQAQIVELLRKLQKERELSLLLISHDLALVQKLCDRVLVMYQGKIVEQGIPDEVIRHPKEEYTKMLVDSVF